MEGYIKTKIGGQERAFKFDLKSFGLILKDVDTPLAKIGDALSNPFLTYPVVLFHGAKRAAEKAGKPVSFTQEDAYEWIEKEEDGVLSEPVLTVVKSFTDSITSLMPKSAMKAAEEEEEQASPNEPSTGSAT